MAQYFFFFCSGSARFVEMAFEHQPAPAEPVSADEGGRRRSGQGAYAVAKTLALMINDLKFTDLAHWPRFYNVMMYKTGSGHKTFSISVIALKNPFLCVYQ